MPVHERNQILVPRVEPETSTNSRIVVLLTLVVTMLTAACQGEQPESDSTQMAMTGSSSAFTAQDEAVIRKMFEDTPAFLRSGDLASWSNLYAETGVFMPPFQRSVTGPAAIMSWGQQLGSVEEIAFTNVQVAGEGNVAYGMSDFTLKVKGRPADSGKQLAVFRRQQDGRWAVVAAAFNSSLPLPIQAAR